MKVLESYRQGDVLIVHVEPENENEIFGTPIPRECGNIILAYGEVTGHSHHIKEVDVQWIKTAQDERVLKSDVPFVIEHEEHKAIALPAGIYFVVQQIEYTPQAIRPVFD